MCLLVLFAGFSHRWMLPDPFHLLSHRLRSLLAWLTTGGCQPTGAIAKGKVVTGAPSYALAWTFLEPVLFAGLAHPWCVLPNGCSSKK
jgi:hypothetical protein